MGKTMRAVIFHGPRRLSLDERPVPTPGPGEALLKIGSALTCGTDFKAFRQGHPVLLGNGSSPFGHEMSGVVEAVGASVTSIKEGDRVVALNSAPCERCDYCEAGDVELCDNLKLLNGAYADYILLPPAIVKHNTHVLPPSLAFATAALAEPFACALHAVERLAPREGEPVAVLGAGNMSRLLVFALKAAGARVIILARNPDRLRLAREAGSDDVVDLSAQPDAVAAIRSKTGGRGAPAVIEAVGKAETWALATSLVRKGGRVCLFGGCAPGTEVRVDAHRVHYDELRLFGVFHHRPPIVKRALALLAQGAVRPELMIDRRIALADVIPFFEANADKSPLKAEVVP